VAYDSGHEHALELSGNAANRLKSVFGRDAVFHDKADLPPGYSYKQSLSTALAATRVLLVIVSEAFALKDREDGVMWELSELAKLPEEKAIILPLYVEDEGKCRTAWREAVDSLRSGDGEYQHSSWDDGSIERLRLATGLALRGDILLFDITDAADAESYGALIDALRARGITSRRPHQQVRGQAHDLILCLCGDVLVNQHSEISLNVLARALWHLVVELLDNERVFDSAKGTYRNPQLVLRIFGCPRARVGFEDVKNVLQDYLAADDKRLPPPIVGGNWWAMLQSRAKLEFANSTDPWSYAVRQQPTGGPGVVVLTFGIEKDYGGLSFHVRWFLRRSHVRWIGFPQGPGEMVSLSSVRAKTLLGGTIDATRLALSGYLMPRLQDHATYLERQTTEDGIRSFSRDLYRLMRELVFAPQTKTSTPWPWIVAICALVLMSIQYYIVQPPPPEPVLRFCGSHTLGEKTLPDELRTLARQIGYELSEVSAASSSATGGNTHKRYSLHNASGTAQDLLVETLLTGSESVDEMFDQHRCDIGMVSDQEVIHTSHVMRDSNRFGVTPVRRETLVLIRNDENHHIEVGIEPIRHSFCSGSQPRAEDPYAQYTLVVRDSLSGTRHFIERELCQGHGFRPGRLTELPGANEDVREYVEQHPRTLGFVPEDLVQDSLPRGVTTLEFDRHDFVRDLYYVHERHGIHAGTVALFIKLLDEQLPKPLFTACGSTSIGEDMLPELFESYVKQKFGNGQGEVKRSKKPIPAPFDLGTNGSTGTQGQATPTWDRRVLHNIRYKLPKTVQEDYAIAAVLNGSKSFVAGAMPDECALGMSSAGGASRSTDSQVEVPFGHERIVAIVATNSELSWDEISPTLCDNSPGTTAAAHLVLRTTSSGTRDFVRSQVCPPPDHDFRPLHVDAGDVLAPDNQAVAKSVADDPDAVGFVPIGVFANAQGQGYKIRELDVPEPLKSKLNRKLTLYLNENAEGYPAARAFVDYVRDEHPTINERFQLIDDSECFAYSPVRIPCQGCNPVYGELTTRTGSREAPVRVPFPTGSSSITRDNQRSEVEKLVKELLSPACSALPVCVLGVENRIPHTSLNNKNLSQERADTIADALKARGVNVARAVGVGVDQLGEPRGEIWVSDGCVAPSKPVQTSTQTLVRPHHRGP